MRKLTIAITIEDSTYDKMVEFFSNTEDQAGIEGIIGNNLEADLNSGDLSILDIMKPGLPDEEDLKNPDSKVEIKLIPIDRASVEYHYPHNVGIIRKNGIEIARFHFDEDGNTIDLKSLNSTEVVDALDSLINQFGTNIK
jgi:hypothetical protein